MRLVLPVPGRRLPTAEAFELRVEPAGEVVDLGRLLVGPGFRGDPSQRAWGGLFALAWQETRLRGYEVMAGVASVRLLSAIGCSGSTEILGPTRTYWVRSATRSASIPRLPRHRTGSEDPPGRRAPADRQTES